MEITRNNLLTLVKNGMKRNSLSIAGLEREAGVPKDTIRDFLRGKTQILRADKLQKVLYILEPEQKLTITGTVGDDAVIRFEEDEETPIECPPGLDPADVVAVRIQGKGMLPVFHDGWIVYYSRRQDIAIPAISGGWQVPYSNAEKAQLDPFAEFIGKPSIVGLDDSTVLLGTLKRGKNGYDLINHNDSDRHGIKPKWAAKIIFIKTT